MTDPQAAVEQALKAAAEALPGLGPWEGYGEWAAAMLATPAMAEVARKAAAWDDATERLHTSPTCFCGDHDDIERSFMNGRHLERIAAALGTASPEEQGE